MSKNCQKKNGQNAIRECDEMPLFTDDYHAPVDPVFYTFFCCLYYWTFSIFISSKQTSKLGVILRCIHLYSKGSETNGTYEIKTE